jgi:ubiquinone/menaquinone biosynthesis C-methylase UbiE
MMGNDTSQDYSLGYSESALSYMGFRSAERCCAFFRDRMDAASEVLDCGCGPGSITLGLAE